MRHALSWLLTAVVPAIVVTGCSSPTKPTGNTCAAPSYPVTELRWEGFPIRVYVEEPELIRRGYSAARTAAISQLVLQGIGSWSSTTGGQVGGVTKISDSTNSQLNVVFRTGAGFTLHDTVQGNFIRHATIELDPAEAEKFGAPFTQVINSVSFRDGADHRWINGSAHEMGHALGIVEHPTTPGSLMINAPEQLIYETPQTIDVNSILRKYHLCS